MQVRQEQYNNISLPQVAGPCPGRGPRGQGGQVHPTLTKNEVFNVELAPLSLLNKLFGIFLLKNCYNSVQCILGPKQLFNKAVPLDQPNKTFYKNICPEFRSTDRTGLLFFCICDKHTGTYFYMLHCIMQVCSLYAQIFRFDQVFVQNFRFNEVYAQNYRFDEDFAHNFKFDEVYAQTSDLMRCTHKLQI